MTNKAKTTIAQLPNKNITTKSAVCPLNEFSSSIRQYRYVNIILKKKLKPNVPKKRNVVNILHTWKFTEKCDGIFAKMIWRIELLPINYQTNFTWRFLQIRIGLKYNWNGESSSSWTDIVVNTHAVVYARVTGGISIYAWRIMVGKDILCILGLSFDRKVYFRDIL